MYLNLEFSSNWLNLLSKIAILCSLEILFFLSIPPLYPRTSINRVGRCRPLNPLLHFPSSTLLFTFLRITRVTVLGAPASFLSSRSRCHSRKKKFDNVNEDNILIVTIKKVLNTSIWRFLSEWIIKFTSFFSTIFYFLYFTKRVF